MMRRPTGYYRPATVEEAVRLLCQPHIKTVLLSGGALRLAARAEYEAVIDVQAIPDLSRITVDEQAGRLEIGAAISLQALLESAAVPTMLKQVIARVVPLNRRNAISLAEALEFPAEIPELIAALVALDATLVIASPQEEATRLVDLLEHPQGGLPETGLIIRVVIDRGGLWHAWGAAQVAQTPAGKAIVSVVAVVEANEAGVIQAARIGLSGVWQRPAGLAAAAAQALAGKTLTDEVIEQAVGALEGEIAPVADYRGSAEYRRTIAAVVTRRALLACRDRLNA
ncbi:MAG: FAD binding domain-containing protein [Anaerolineae bacterium]|nr:FAD binding domain-containing protein [Anaerolineae bacterium]